MSAPSPPPIELKQVRYLADGRPVLDGVDLTVNRGEVVGVMGRSGTGKTTLLRLVMGLIPATSGQVLVGGTDIGVVPERELERLRLKMGMVFQGAALFDSMNVFDNVAFGPRQHRRGAEDELRRLAREKLELVGLRDIDELMPSDLSGGMRKRVGIARALAMEPQVMLFDEPTAGLDPITSRAIENLIARLRAELGMTCLVVSHDVEGLFHFVDRAALLYGGRILATGRPAELRSSEDALVRQFVTGSVEGPIHVV